jgi:hypothetical protein
MALHDETAPFRHYLTKDIEERSAFRRLRERQLEPVFEFMTLCSERLVAHVNRGFLLEVYEESAALQAAFTRDAFYAEVSPPPLDRNDARFLLASFSRAVAAAPDDAIRNLIFHVWEEVMTARPDAEVLLSIDQMRRSLLDYVVRGQELAVASPEHARVARRGIPVVPAVEAPVMPVAESPAA